ncbi:MAG: hypothetical protein WC803_02015 [Sphingomonas sp.]
MSWPQRQLPSLPLAQAGSPGLGVPFVAFASTLWTSALQPAANCCSGGLDDGVE